MLIIDSVLYHMSKKTINVPIIFDSWFLPYVYGYSVYLISLTCINILCVLHTNQVNLVSSRMPFSDNLPLRMTKLIWRMFVAW